MGLIGWLQVGDEQEGGRKEDAPRLLLGDRTDDGMWCHVSGKGTQEEEPQAEDDELSFRVLPRDKDQGWAL